MKKQAGLKRVKALLATFVFLSLIVLQPMAVLAEETVTEGIASLPEASGIIQETQPDPQDVPGEPVQADIPADNAAPVTDAEAPTGQAADAAATPAPAAAVETPVEEAPVTDAEPTEEPASDAEAPANSEEDVEAPAEPSAASEVNAEPAEDTEEAAPATDTETPAEDAVPVTDAETVADAVASVEESASTETEAETPAEESAPAEAEKVIPADPAPQPPVSVIPDVIPAQPEAVPSRTAEIQVDNHIITVSGAFPEGAEIQAVTIPMDSAALLAGEVPLFAYDIRLVVDGQVWQPEDHGTEVQLSVRNADGSEESYKTNILHVKKDFLDSEGRISEESLKQALQEMKDAAADTESLAGNADGSSYTFTTSSFSGFLVGSTNVKYIYDATLFNNDSENYAGVYETKINPNTSTAEEAKTNATIGIPSIADANLPDAPTTESPAIIQGAAVSYDKRISATEYEKIREKPKPYSEFLVKILEEKGQDGTVHKKPSGFDGTYVILRLDVSEFFTEGSTGTDNLYLHMQQKDNKALMPAATVAKGTAGATEKDWTPTNTFTDGLGNRSAAYLLSELVDEEGGKPYVDVIVFATAANVAGADAGKENTPNGDIPLAFYVDKQLQYNDELTVYDPTSVDTKTDPDAATKYTQSWHDKFFDAEKAKEAAAKVSNYLVKGSDLALEVSVENSGGENKDTGTTYWSLEKSFQHHYYDLPEDKNPDDPASGRTVKMMSEVAITDQMDLVGGTEGGVGENEVRKRTLDVNSYDVQVAKNTSSTASTGINLKDAWLTLLDSSNTTGAEVAIGNNAKFIIDKGGKLIIDETCQLEIEWDAATVQPGEQAPDPTASGMLDLRPGGELVNNGVITIEGYEGKPQPQETTAPETQKQCGEMTIDEGATLTNNGAMVVNGILYNLGTLVNNGKYTDTIISNDPDQGQFAYHKGIVVSWKDDVTQSGVKPGALINGKDSSGKSYAKAELVNNGDILLNPGSMENYAVLGSKAAGSIWLGVVTEAIIPITPTAEAPTVVTKRITLDKPVGSTLTNNGKLHNEGKINPASVVLNDNASLGALREPGDHAEYFKIENYNENVVNDGTIYGVTKHDAKAPTCTEIGWDAYETVSWSDYTSYKEKPALGHDLIHHEVKAPTCTEVGWSAYDTCSRCDYTTYKEIPALGHDLIQHEAQAPTCTMHGWNAYQTCSRCDYTTYEEIPATGHTLGPILVENQNNPTCTSEGGFDEAAYCTVCGEEVIRNHITLSALGHDYTETDRTITRIHYACRRCGDLRGEDNPLSENLIPGLVQNENGVELPYSAGVTRESGKGLLTVTPELQEGADPLTARLILTPEEIAQWMNDGISAVRLICGDASLEITLSEISGDWFGSNGTANDVDAYAFTLSLTADEAQVTVEALAGDTATPASSLSGLSLRMGGTVQEVTANGAYKAAD